MYQILKYLRKKIYNHDNEKTHETISTSYNKKNINNYRIFIKGTINLYQFYYRLSAYKEKNPKINILSTFSLKFWNSQELIRHFTYFKNYIKVSDRDDLWDIFKNKKTSAYFGILENWTVYSNINKLKPKWMSRQPYFQEDSNLWFLNEWLANPNLHNTIDTDELNNKYSYLDFNRKVRDWNLKNFWTGFINIKIPSIIDNIITKLIKLKQILLLFIRVFTRCWTILLNGEIFYLYKILDESELTLFYFVICTTIITIILLCRFIYLKIKKN